LRKKKKVAVKLRLVRTGKKKQPTYRLVAADSRSPRNGRFIEILGTYEPRHDPSVIKFDNDRAVHWLRHGAQPTETVEKLLRISGAWEQFTGKPLEPVVYPEKKSAPLEASEEPAAEEASEEPAAEEAVAEEASEEPAAEEAVAEEASEEPAAEESSESENSKEEEQ
jgi:small subunit ribosomal protein S16|tara:strand:- start:297 stop:797 length:501 start_codon:yes stop_codon:yes gene_type:complete